MSDLSARVTVDKSRSHKLPGFLDRTPVAVEKLTHVEFAEMGSRQEAPQTGDRARVERAMEALAQFVEWRVTPTEMMGREPKELNGR